jgi:fructose-bisphosphate aldolase class I
VSAARSADRGLIGTAAQMVAGDRGLLAIDESPASCNRRFAAVGIPQTPEMRHAYRDVLITTQGLGASISGAILSDETFHQSTHGGVPFVRVLEAAGVLPGIKVDLGAVDLAGHPGEKITEGLDGLRQRLAQYASQGARFAKWRAVITIAPGVGPAALPSAGCIAANAHALARYAALCQEAGIVPIVEPEVLMDGDHTLKRCAAVTERVLRDVFAALYRQRVLLEGIVLKPSMVIAGSDCGVSSSVDAVADATLQCLRQAVPAAVAGVAFLSGGQTGPTASAHLNAMHLRAGRAGRGLPWPLTFSYGRALQNPALPTWAGDESHRAAAQRALLQRAACNSAARRGEYQAAMETA